MEGNRHVAGAGDTYAFCAKPKVGLLYTHDHYKYYKVEVHIRALLKALDLKNFLPTKNPVRLLQL